MRIWFDLSNSPHINMFAAMIRDLEREHEVVITCRPLANTIDLLELHGFKYQVVGVHYGGKLMAKLFGFPYTRIENGWDLVEVCETCKREADAVRQVAEHPHQEALCASALR